LLVKSLVDEGSAGIAQASVVYNDEKLAERVDFIHRQYEAPAIAEQYIDGREIYVGVIGNQRLQSYPPWELIIENLPEGSANFATSMVKWDPKYQERRGVITKAAELEPEIVARFAHVSKRIYRLLHLSGYARIDYRLTPDGRIYVLEANPNPQISTDGEFAD
jgi:D-alanine-D-alanine ligase